MGMHASDDINKIVKAMKASKNTVVVTGAGISTEAGIPDFRGQNGIYRQLGENRVMNIINIDYFRREPEKFYEFFRAHFDFPAAEPSKAHYILADMETKGFVRGVVTQNIDHLHQKAGSKKVVAIHGNAGQYICTSPRCKNIVSSDYVEQNYPDTVPRCPECSSILKPDVILFGENIYNYIDAREMILGARLVIVIGSSLTVYPLAGLVKEFSTFTQDLIIINKGFTHLDHAAMVKIEVGSGSSGDILEEVMRGLTD